jgi:hypothetical protein
MLRIPHCLDNRLTGGGEVVSLTRRPLSTLQKYFPSVYDTQFSERLKNDIKQLYPEERAPVTQGIGGFGGPQSRSQL